MPSSAISQPRLSTPTLVKSMFNSSGLSLALVRDYIFSFHTNMILYFLLQTIFYVLVWEILNITANKFRSTRW